MSTWKCVESGITHGRQFGRLLAGLHVSRVVNHEHWNTPLKYLNSVSCGCLAPRGSDLPWSDAVLPSELALIGRKFWVE